MSFLVLIVLAIFAVYRLSHMVAVEDGPFDIFARLRERSGQDTWVGRGMNCVLCLSFWVSLAASLAIFELDFDLLIIGWFGIAGVVTFIHKVSDGAA